MAVLQITTYIFSGASRSKQSCRYKSLPVNVFGSQRIAIVIDRDVQERIVVGRCGFPELRILFEIIEWRSSQLQAHRDANRACAGANCGIDGGYVTKDVSVLQIGRDGRAYSGANIGSSIVDQTRNHSSSSVRWARVQEWIVEPFVGVLFQAEEIV